MTRAVPAWPRDRWRRTGPERSGRRPRRGPRRGHRAFEFGSLLSAAVGGVPPLRDNILDGLGSASSEVDLDRAVRDLPAPGVFLDGIPCPPRVLVLRVLAVLEGQGDRPMAAVHACHRRGTRVPALEV